MAAHQLEDLSLVVVVSPERHGLPLHAHGIETMVLFLQSVDVLGVVEPGLVCL